jgi:hypothetical protein
MESAETKRDFLTDLFFHYSDAELRQNYLLFVDMAKKTFTTLPPQVVSTMEKFTTCRKSMQLMMLFVIVMDDTNGLAQHAEKNAVPRWRFMYFKRLAKIILDLYVRPQRAGDCRVPDPTNLMATLWSTYPKFTDNGTEWRDYYAKLEASEAAAATAQSATTPRMTKQ